MGVNTNLLGRRVQRIKDRTQKGEICIVADMEAGAFGAGSPPQIGLGILWNAPEGEPRLLGMAPLSNIEVIEDEVV